MDPASRDVAARVFRPTDRALIEWERNLPRPFAYDWTHVLSIAAVKWTRRREFASVLGVLESDLTPLRSFAREVFDHYEAGRGWDDPWIEASRIEGELTKRCGGEVVEAIRVSVRAVSMPPDDREAAARWAELLSPYLLEPIVGSADLPVPALALREARDALKAGGLTIKWLPTPISDNWYEHQLDLETDLFVEPEYALPHLIEVRIAQVALPVLLAGSETRPIFLVDWARSKRPANEWQPPLQIPRSLIVAAARQGP